MASPSSVTRTFRITGVVDANPPGAVAPFTNRLMVTAVPIGDSPATPAPPAPPGQSFSWPFDDPDGSVAAFFVVNQEVDLVFQPRAVA